MIVKRQVLQAALPATSDDNSRYFLQFVQVCPDGRVRATDGHIALTVSDAHPIDDADFPTEGIPAFHGTPAAPVLVSAEVIGKLIKAMPKKARNGIPALQAVQITTNGDGGPVISATDLTAPCTVHLKDQDSSFPNLDAIQPPKDRPSLTVCLGVPVLEAMIKSAKAIEATAITFTFPTDQPIVLSSFELTYGEKGGGISVQGVAMPCRV